MKAHATVFKLSESIPQEVLSESVPTAFAPNDFNTPDFQIRWAGDPIPGVEFKIAEGTLQWVRVNEVLVVPRARLILDADKIEGGQITHAGFSQVFEGGHAEIPIALVSGKKNPISLSLKREGKLVSGELWVEFNPRKDLPPQRVFLDPSCSPYDVSTESRGKPGNDWVYIGCRLVRVRGGENRTPSLELYVFWDNTGPTIQIENIETPAGSGSVWPIRVNSEPGSVSLRGGEHEIEVNYHVGKNLHNVGLSLGLGPYIYAFQGGGDNVDRVVPFVTLYGSYFITEAMRVVGFGATAIDSRNYTDLGLYLYIEYARFLDRRVVINLLVGGHAIGYRADQYYFVAALPQGAEVVYVDAFSRGNSLKLGAFIYPPLSNNAYYNAWLRWGSSKFIELNYIYWQSQPKQEVFSSSSVGISVGFPLFQFW